MFCKPFYTLPVLKFLFREHKPGLYILAILSVVDAFLLTTVLISWSFCHTFQKKGYLLPLYSRALRGLILVLLIRAITLTATAIFGRQYWEIALSFVPAFLYGVGFFAPLLVYNVILLFVSQTSSGKRAIQRSLSVAILLAIFFIILSTIAGASSGKNKHFPLLLLWCLEGFVSVGCFCSVVCVNKGKFRYVWTFIMTQLLSTIFGLMSGIFYYTQEDGFCCILLVGYASIIESIALVYSVYRDSLYWSRISRKLLTHNNPMDAFQAQIESYNDHSIQNRYHSVGEFLSMQIDLIDKVDVDERWKERGGRARIRLGTYKNQMVAIKEIVFRELTPAIVADFCKEALLSKNFSHPNVVKFLGCSITPPTLSLIYEYCNQKSLRHVLSSSMPLSWELRVQFILDGCRGMEYLHKEGIIHRDLKPENLLVHRKKDGKFVLKVCDFGLSRIMENDAVSSVRISLGPDEELDEEHMQMTTLVGTTPFLAPEILEHIDLQKNKVFSLSKTCQYGYPADVFSYGCVIWEIITRSSIWEGMFFPEIKTSILNGQRPVIPEDCQAAKNCPRVLIDVMDRCWEQNPDLRWTFDQLVEQLDASFPDVEGGTDGEPYE